MQRRNYGQVCSVATALDRIGERWSLLIVRELLLGPLRFTDLARYVGGAPTDVLSRRLRDLEADGIVSRRELTPPASGTVYELTELGEDLEEPMLALGNWGIAFFNPSDLLALEPHMFPHMLRHLIEPAGAGPSTILFRVPGGPFTLECVEPNLKVTRGEPSSDPDLTISGGPLEILWLLARGMRPGTDRDAATALIGSARGHEDPPEVRTKGDSTALEALFARVSLPDRLRLPQRI